MNEFLQRLQLVVESRRLFSRGQKILIAVSGGADSMVLLHALHALAAQNRWQISVAHFNHRLRGRASAADERLVRQTAKKLGLKFFGGDADVKSFARESKLSIEMAARKLRHEFLARTAREQGIATIALAHHAADQVELFFLRLLRGAGGEGLAGMKWRSPSPAAAKVVLVRPLLGFSKVEIRAFASAAKISFREDTSNFSRDFLRNRIRNELLPLLRKRYQPAVDKTVLRLMEIIGAEAEVVEGVASSLRLDRIRPQAEHYSQLPVALQRRIIRQQLIDLKFSPEFELVEQLRETPDKPVNITAGVYVQSDHTGKVICLRPAEAEFKTGKQKLVLSGKRGKTDFSNRNFSWVLKSFSGSRGRSPHQIGAENFDADKIGGEIILRHWQAGDRFQPIGMKSSVKLQDLFVNAKIPAARRRELVLAEAANGEIFWVEGLRIGENFKLTPNTKRCLLWSLTAHPAMNRHRPDVGRQ